MGAVLTPEQSRGARRKLGFTQADVIEKSGLSAYKLKQFESGFADPEGIAPYLKQLRTFYEKQGITFDEPPPPRRSPDRHANEHFTAEGGGQDGRPVSVNVRREAMFLCQALTDTEKEAIYSRLEANRDELRKLAAVPAEQGFLDPFSEATDKHLARATDLIKEQGVLYGLLFGQCVFAAPTEELLKHPRKAATVGDAVATTFANLFRDSGLLAAREAELETPHGEEEEEAAV